MNDCVFCKIVSGELPGRHIESLKNAEDDDIQVLGKIQLMAKKMAEKFEITDGYKVMINAGKFQEVPHIHYHLKGGMN